MWKCNVSSPLVFSPKRSPTLRSQKMRQGVRYHQSGPNAKLAFPHFCIYTSTTNCNLFSVFCLCEACTSGHYGKNCAQECDCSGSQCNTETGECICEAGKLGRDCSQRNDHTLYKLTVYVFFNFFFFICLVCSL